MRCWSTFLYDLYVPRLIDKIQKIIYRHKKTEVDYIRKTAVNNEMNNQVIDESVFRQKKRLLEATKDMQ